MGKILFLYHFYYPDDVVSALQFTDLAEGLVKKGFEIETWPSNRSRHHSSSHYSLKKEIRKGVLIRRIWRPDFNQEKFLGRILNALWMEIYWIFRLFLTRNPPDAVLIGTDPIFAIFLVPFIRLRFPKLKTVHWCFDMYPEYPIADGVILENSIWVKVIRYFLVKAYQACDLVVDTGICMRKVLARYPIKNITTNTPWALEEPKKSQPIDKNEREKLFGKNRLGILYSGNFGRPHSYKLSLKLARQMRRFEAAFAYSARGSRLSELKESVAREDVNIRFVDFAAPNKLVSRLAAPDIHLVSLGDNWTGILVPSKFFGSLAVGRPVLFEGNPDSSIAKWINEYGVGWVLRSDNLKEIAMDLVKFSRNLTRKKRMFRHCHRIYQHHFSKKNGVENWARDLRLLKKRNFSVGI